MCSTGGNIEEPRALAITVSAGGLPPPRPPFVRPLRHGWRRARQSLRSRASLSHVPPGRPSWLPLVTFPASKVPVVPGVCRVCKVQWGKRCERHVLSRCVVEEATSTCADLCRPVSSISSSSSSSRRSSRRSSSSQRYKRYKRYKRCKRYKRYKR